MYRIKVFIVVFSIITLSTTQAQYSRFTINIAGGKSLSVRELATKVFGETRGELADDGLSGQIIAAYYPTKRIGLATRFSYNQNKTRQEGIRLIAQNQYNVVNPVVESAEDWNVASAMIGPSLRLGGSKLGLEARLLVGYAIVNSPSFVTTGTFQGFNIRVQTQTQKASDLAYGAGATLNIGLTRAIALVINADASLISTTFKNVGNQVSTMGFPTLTQQVDIEQNVGVVNVTGGVRFSF